MAADSPRLYDQCVPRSFEVPPYRRCQGPPGAVEIDQGSARVVIPGDGRYVRTGTTHSAVVVWFLFRTIRARLACPSMHHTGYNVVNYCLVDPFRAIGPR